MTAHSSLISDIPGVLHGFGDKTALLPATLQPWQQTLPIKKQVHGIHVHPVTQAAEPCGDADGLMTSTPGVLLTVLTADCLPLLFCRRDGKRIAVLHAGWRGLLAGIIERFADLLAQDDDPGQWVVAIGPAAGACCYEVDEKLVTEFLTTLPLPATLVSPAYRRLDLPAIARYKLEHRGFSAVDDIGHCTICTTINTDNTLQQPCFQYTSFRRNSHRRAIDPTYPTISGRNQYSGLLILP